MREYNNKFFKVWSEDMAYILGFITADGNVYKNTLSVQLQCGDKKILDFIATSICPTAPIENSTINGNNYCRLRLHSKDIITSLEVLGITPNKSFSIEVPPGLPEKYIASYARGVFDGDGWVCTRRNSIECGICSASEVFLVKLRVLFNSIGRLRTRVKGCKNPLYVWDMSINDTLKFRDIIYNPKGFCLNRKKEVFYSNFYIPSSSRWTKEQLTYLEKNYIPGQSPSLIADVINKSYKAVSKKIWELNLRDKYL